MEIKFYFINNSISLNNIKNNNIIYPIKIKYNKYYSSLYNSTNKDKRIYNHKEILIKILKLLLNNEHFDNDTQIKKHRK